MHIVLTAENFRDLVAGLPINHTYWLGPSAGWAHAEITLSDIGFDTMREAIREAEEVAKEKTS